MKTILSVLIALWILSGIAVPLSAVGAKSFYDPQGRNVGGSSLLKRTAALVAAPRLSQR